MAADSTMIRNNHFLWIISGVSTHEQLQESLMTCLNENGICTDFKISVVSNRNGLCGYAYIWIKDPNVFRMLAGEDENGRCETAKEIPNPNWTPPDTPLEEALQQLEEEFDDDDYDTPWEKMAAMGDAKLALEQQYKPDMIVVPDQCKLKLPPFKLTEEQQRHYQQQNKLRGQPDLEVPTYVDYVVTSAYYGKDKMSHNQDVLSARNIPYWLNERDLKRLFEPYVEDTETKATMILNKRQVEDTYPFVVISSRKGRRGKSERSAYVYFNPKDGEARMIIHVCRRMTVCKKMRDGTVATANIVFNHPRVQSYN